MSQRGRPKGSLGKKKIEEAAAMRAQQLSLSLSPTLTRETYGESNEDSEDAKSMRKLTDTLDNSIELIYAELQKIRKEFGKAIEKNTKDIKGLKAENVDLRDRCQSLERKVADISKTQMDQLKQINKQERFSRRNNLRIVGKDSSPNEDCLKIASEVFTKVGVQDCVVERVKVVHFQDKVSILKNARPALRSEDYYIIDDLTKADLMEKRKWLPKVNDLFRSGVRLHFSGGCWRAQGGKPYEFTSVD
ncbi:hypothetical protein BSL78_21994 [Apostichopus japonicus]|uniref:Uncharacterized protein n=1 Tax=Stichopus japonicus TaxID=307972 RepID=A0A2G8JZJ9_STIJA|nr:hypothetical protein BSL78_21994 [Apostichopus japonicus]